MRSILALLPAALLLSTAPAQAAIQAVDLDQPDAIERVRRDNPAHYRAIQHILRTAPDLQPRAITGWIRTSYGPKAPPVLSIKTSYPPRARLEFALDDTRYVTLVTSGRSSRPCCRLVDGRSSSPGSAQDATALALLQTCASPFPHGNFHVKIALE